MTIREGAAFFVYLQDDVASFGVNCPATPSAGGPDTVKLNKLGGPLLVR